MKVGCVVFNFQSSHDTGWILYIKVWINRFLLVKGRSKIITRDIFFAQLERTKPQNLHIRRIFFNIQTQIYANFSRGFLSSRSPSIFFLISRRLLDKHIAVYVPCIGSLKGQKWLRVQHVVISINSQINFPSKLHGAFPLSTSRKASLEKFFETKSWAPYFASGPWEIDKASRSGRHEVWGRSWKLTILITL